MAITVKHKFVSAIPDAGDPTIVQPSNWNDTHDLVGTVPVVNGGTGAATLTGYVKGSGTSNMTASATIPNTDITGLGTASTKDAGVANGVATLDGSGTVPISQLPAAVLGALSYQGTWNASTNTPTLTSSVGTKGYYYVVNVSGNTNLNGITDWLVGDWAVYNGTAWQKVDNTDAVTSVNGYTGTVVLNAADVGAVPYTGATTAVDLNAKSLTNVSNLGVGTTVVPTIKIRAIGDNNSSSRIAMRGYSSDANSSSIRVTKFRGSASVPQAPQSGDSLGKFELAGYGTTSSEGYPQASLEGLATEAWGATARGTKAVIKVTPNTTTTQVTALTIDQNSAATFASSVTATSFSGSGSSLTGVVTSVTGTSPVVSSGGTTPAISMPAATTSVNGYLTSTDWTTFNNKSNTNGTVTSVAALTLGTTGTDLSSTVATGTTTPVITLQVPTASATNRGALSAADWTTFNNKGSGTVTSVSGTATRITSTGGTTPVIDLASGVATAGTTGSSTLIPVVTIDTYGRVTSITTAANPQGTVTSVTGTAPVVSSGGATPAISMAAATTSVNGYLTSTDWTTFNNKAPAVTYTSTYVPYGQGTTTPALSANFTYDSTLNNLNAPQVRASNGIVVNSKTVSASYSIASGDSAMSVGPITVATGQTVTIASGSRWVVL